MAAVALSPSPVSISAMASRRAPLSANPNAANSPLRGAAAVLAAATASKQRRSHASAQREDLYGQPPPAKRQMLEHGAKAALRSPTKQKASQAQRVAARPPAAERAAAAPAVHKLSEKDVEEVRKWQLNQRSKFPRLVFYFENIPDDQRARLAKQVAHLGAREEKFFSINITHVITTRPIPPEKPKDEAAVGAVDVENENPQTINPSLLSRSAESARRKLFENPPGKRLPAQAQAQAPEDSVRRPPKLVRNADILVRARDMGKRIWSLEKLQKVLDMLLEPDPYRAAAVGQGSRNGSAAVGAGASRAPEESMLLQQLLNKERINGPSDRDPTVVTRELNYFKGPYIYIYDIEEKQKPIMVREYIKVADKQDGDWPQFRASASGRCPFLEDTDTVEKKEAQRSRQVSVARAAAETAVPKLQPPSQVAPAKPVTGKRSLAQMEDGHNRRAHTGLRPSAAFDPNMAAKEPSIDFQPQNAFTSRARAGRLFAGEPVASGLQAAGVTSAIRSQMISSATGTLGSKAGTSKAIHGLQRKVLQTSAVATSQDPSSRRMHGMSMDQPSFVRSASIGQTSQRTLDVINESRPARGESHKRTMSVPLQPAKQKRDPKPGYCENCQDKFEDFEEHTVSRKHRRFADETSNWTSLDSLLTKLERAPKSRKAHDYA